MDGDFGQRTEKTDIGLRCLTLVMDHRKPQRSGSSLPRTIRVLTSRSGSSTSPTGNCLSGFVNASGRSLGPIARSKRSEHRNGCQDSDAGGTEHRSGCASCAPTRCRRGRPRGEEPGAVPGIMSRYAQRRAAGTARALSASGRITDTMPGPFGAARGPRGEIPKARNPSSCRIDGRLPFASKQPVGVTRCRR